MSPSEPPAWFFLIPVVWIAGCIGASILYRRAVGKPIIPRTPPAVVFEEGRASGWNDASWIGRLGGANNCLMVAVTDRDLVVTPFFPFNLMFLPEIYGLELRTPLSRIQRIEDRPWFFRRAVMIETGDGRRMGVVLRDPEAFKAALRLRA